MSGRPKRERVLSESEFEQLKALTTRRETAIGVAVASAHRAGLAEAMDNKAVAAKLRLTQQTVSKWRVRSVADRVDDCFTRHAPAHPRQSTTRMLTRLWRRRLSPCLPGRRIGARERWPER